MKVLIIGAKGMLGQALVAEFSKSDHAVTAWDKQAADPKDRLDVTDLGEVRQKIIQLSPEIIINASAYTNVDGAETDKETAMLVNGRAVGYLAGVAKQIGATLVHYSTDYVFDGAKPAGYTEDDAPNPISEYGRSKLRGEQELQELQSSTGRYYLIRLSRLFGMPGAGKVSAVEDRLKDLATKGSTKAPDTEVSCFTYAPDLAKSTREIVEGSLPFGIYHRVNEGAVTWFRMAQMVAAKLGRGSVEKVAPDYFPRVAKIPQYGILRSTKLPPMRRFTDALTDFINERQN